MDFDVAYQLGFKCTQLCVRLSGCYHGPAIILSTISVLKYKGLYASSMHLDKYLYSLQVHGQNPVYSGQR